MRRRYGKHFSVILGDWSDAGKMMRFQESSKTKGFRTLFARNGIPCYLLDEYRTSSVCPHCHGRVKKNIRQQLSSRPWQARKGRMEYVHGLVGCPNPECINQDWTPFEIPGRRQPLRLRMKVHNRDVQSTKNFLSIVRSVVFGDGRRPDAFSRNQ
ncbi:uncharacterized protein EV422DRAFT_605127 [Fimicolochytrium jonesii]|uniref:uncharacterized protein n=1 Tax=Fimicolochytrium jonesii TaxID=1396493 RepID=UPI0022FEBE44